MNEKINALIDSYGAPDRSEDQKEDRKVYVENMLFATLDTTVRKIILPDRKEFLLSDTVGFVSRLPHHLVEAFHSTLEEVRYADLLVEVVDYTDPNYEEQMRVTRDTLKELSAEQIPCIHVYNKCDLIADDKDRLPRGIPRVVKTGDRKAIYMAAGKGIGLSDLVGLIREEIYKDYVDCVMVIPYAEGALVSYFNENATVLETEYLDQGTRLTMQCKYKDLQKYKEYVE